MHLEKTARRRIFHASLATLAVAGLLVVGNPSSSPISLSSAVTITMASEASVGAQETLELESYLNKKGPASALDVVIAQAPVTREKVETYTIVSGDNIILIAERFDLKVDTLLWANNLNISDIIQPGQELVVPAVDGVIHEVRSGETLSEIAALYLADLDDVVQSNPEINPGLLKPGDLLIIPGGEPGFRRIVASARNGGRSNAVAFDRWPADGPLTDTFGWRVHPVFGTSNFHDGIDIGAPSGSPVRAVTGGTITMATRHGGYGLTVRIDHGGGVVTQYAHLSQTAVVVGESVNSGQRIGDVGNTGNSTGPHLHFTVLVGGSPVDPSSWLP